LISANPHIALPYHGLLSLPFTVKLIYPNFTGSGFLSFSYCKSGSSKLNLLVGKKRAMSLVNENNYLKPCEWDYVTTPINSTKETASSEMKNNINIMNVIHSESLTLRKYSYRDNENVLDADSVVIAINKENNTDARVCDI
jgi:hypothetical protein